MKLIIRHFNQDQFPGRSNRLSTSPGPYIGYTNHSSAPNFIPAPNSAFTPPSPYRGQPQTAAPVPQVGINSYFTILITCSASFPSNSASGFNSSSSSRSICEAESAAQSRTKPFEGTSINLVIFERTSIEQTSPSSYHLYCNLSFCCSKWQAAHTATYAKTHASTSVDNTDYVIHVWGLSKYSEADQHPKTSLRGFAFVK